MPGARGLERVGRAVQGGERGAGPAEATPVPPAPARAALGRSAAYGKRGYWMCARVCVSGLLAWAPEAPQLG